MKSPELGARRARRVFPRPFRGKPPGTEWTDSEPEKERAPIVRGPGEFDVDRRAGSHTASTRFRGPSCLVRAEPRLRTGY